MQRRKVKKSKDAGSTSSSISTASVQLIIEKLLGQQHRDSMKKTYLAVWRKFNSFYMKLDVKPKSWSWEYRMSLFVAYLIEQGLQSCSIKSYVSAIKAEFVIEYLQLLQIVSDLCLGKLRFCFDSHC